VEDGKGRFPLWANLLLLLWLGHYVRWRDKNKKEKNGKKRSGPSDLLGRVRYARAGALCPGGLASLQFRGRIGGCVFNPRLLPLPVSNRSPPVPPPLVVFISWRRRWARGTALYQVFVVPFACDEQPAGTRAPSSSSLPALWNRSPKT